MRSILTLFALPLLLFSTYAVETVDPAYQDALDKALQVNPPGDYNGPNVRHFPLFTPSPKSNRVSQPLSVMDLYLLKPVDPSDKDIKILFSEAASYFVQGRWDLAIKRYKQSLLQYPENMEAKASLFDILTLQCMYESNAEQGAINKIYDKLKARLSNDIIPEEK
ncbi:MAG: hypothetical protein ACOYM3_32775 [Terrimicrobiaceae bacterium]